MQSSQRPACVGVIIVNWNGKADTLECLASLAADQYPDKRIIVVDNGSTDDSVAAIRAAFPAVCVIETGKNLGFTGGNNAGIQRALADGVDYVYLLNNDTTSEPNAITQLVRAANAAGKPGIHAPVIHYALGQPGVWFAGARLDLRRGEVLHDNSHIPQRTEAPTDVAWASGCAMLVDAGLIRQLGGFDDRFFLLSEDADLSLRALAAGGVVRIVPAARICHKVSRTLEPLTRQGCYYGVRNSLLLVRLHLREGVRRATVRILWLRFREAGQEFRRHGFAGFWRFRSVAKAAWHHWRGLYGPIDSPRRFSPLPKIGDRR